jgi:hypothetical protein
MSNAKNEIIELMKYNIIQKAIIVKLISPRTKKTNSNGIMNMNNSDKKCVILA